MRDERWFGASIGAEPFCLILQLRDHKYKIISLDLVSVPNDCSIPLQNIEEITRGLGVVVLSRRETRADHLLRESFDPSVKYFMVPVFCHYQGY